MTLYWCCTCDHHMHIYTICMYSPVMAVYHLGFAEGPITATKVVLSRAVNLFIGKGSHCRQDSWTPVHSSIESRPKCMGSSEAVKIKRIAFIVSNFPMYSCTSYVHFIPVALVWCWKAVTPSEPIPQIMYWFWLVGSIGLSHIPLSAAVTSSVHKKSNK